MYPDIKSRRYPKVVKYPGEAGKSQGGAISPQDAQAVYGKQSNKGKMVANHSMSPPAKQ